MTENVRCDTTDNCMENHSMFEHWSGFHFPACQLATSGATKPDIACHGFQRSFLGTSSLDLCILSFYKYIKTAPTASKPVIRNFAI